MLSIGLIRRAVSAAVVLSILSLGAFADTIRLKDGSIIKGKIVRFSGGTFSVEIGDGSRKRQMTFTSDEVESIQFDAPDLRQVSQSRDTNPGIIKVSTTGGSDPIEKLPLPPRVITTDNTTVSKDTPVKKTPSKDTSAKSNDNDASQDPVDLTPEPSVTSSKPSVTSSSAPKTQPVELSIKVLADNTSNGWTNSGWVVRKGQRIRISGDGTISLGKGQKSTPSGVPDLADDQKLLKSVATGALIAVIGDDNNDFIYVGSSREFTASRDGTLFLGVNEGNLDDNSGSFNVKIQILPN